MIKANELRIGNLITYNPYGNQEGKLVSIAGMLGMKAYFNKYSNESGMFHHLKPIGLTDEWLLRLGFDNGYRRIDEHGLLKILPSGKFQVIDITNDETYRSYDNKIEYVHQLQNLFFALSDGIELEVKL